MQFDYLRSSTILQKRYILIYIQKPLYFYDKNFNYIIKKFLKNDFFIYAHYFMLNTEKIKNSNTKKIFHS